jgi:glycosyltransferase involved in cell wall biosynthesis
MKKLLCIAPHLSTGGLPQYLTKKVELIKDEFEIYLIEWDNLTGGVLVVQKNRLQEMIPSERFFVLGEDKTELFNIIDKIQPDVIHLEEIPEYFMDFEIAKKLYNQNRSYSLIETSHDSSMDTNNKIFFPDKFIFVSEWQKEQYKNIDVPQEVIYYPIEYKERPNREEALSALGLDPNKKHVLHVGLFTPRKNQSEFFEYARLLPDVEFHSVGNQADNFRDYWEPLMSNKPPNVTWWNERSDVDNFYKAMDLFLFTSRGTNTDKETMPLVIREAISWNMNLLIYNLPVYLDYFDQFDNVDYLDFGDKNKNVNIINSILELSDFQYSKPLNIDLEEEAFIISTYPVTKAIIDTTKECIEAVKKTGRKVILTSHIPIPEELDKLVDYSINDNNNILTKHTFYKHSWISNDKMKAQVNLTGEDNDVYHGPTCYTNYYNGCSLAEGLGIKKVYFLNYDYIIQEDSYVNKISSILNSKNAFFGQDIAAEGNQIITWFLGIHPKFFLQKPKINNAEQYDKLMHDWGSESNGLENLMYHGFKNDLNIHWESKEKFQEECTKTFIHRDYSRVEYFSVLPSNIPNHFVPYVQISNNNDSRLLKYTLEKNGKIINQSEYEVTSKFHTYDIVKFTEGDIFKVIWDTYDLVTNSILNSKVVEINDDYINNQIDKNGLFEWFGDQTEFISKLKIKLMHLVTEPDTNKKEIRSVENIKEFCQLTGIKYEQRINKIWTETPPKDTCNRPNDVQDKPGYYKLAPGHYGCYKAHTDAILAEDNKDYDYILIFEGDVIVDSPFSELRQALDRFSRLSKENNQDIIGFGNPFNNRNLNGPKIEDIYTNVTPFIPAQSYLINNNRLEYIQDKIKSTPWDAFDMWVCNVAQLKVGTAEKIYTKHLPGFSIIEQEFKGMDENSPEIYATI